MKILRICAMAVALLALLLMMVGAPRAFAGSFTFNFNPGDTFSGTAPGNLTATFSDVAGGVQLVITSSLGPGEDLDPSKALYLDMNPADTRLLGSLTFTLTANTGFAQAASVAQGKDAFKADGHGLYDILFTYAPSAKTFTTGESQTYLITATGLDADDFLEPFSRSGVGAGDWMAGVYVQNTRNAGSGSAFVGGTLAPASEAGVLSLLLVSGLFALGYWRRLVS